MSTGLFEFDLGLGGERQKDLEEIAESLGWDMDELASAIVGEVMRRVAGRMVCRPVEAVEAEGNVVPFRRPAPRLPGG